MAKEESSTEESAADPLPDALPGEGSELTAAESRVGELIGKYRLIKCIGSGGMGVVYLAEDALMNRRVAIKILLKEVAKNPVVVQHFLAEAQVTGRLNHPNIIAIYDVLLEKGGVSIVMELLKPGSVLQQVQQRGPLHWIEATRLIADCCSALVATHEAGLIHRDIKPGNILCSPAGITKLVDFGMVKELPQHSEEAENSQANYLKGTVTYMSPEQIAGKPIDKRSDIYSLGVTYYELLAGRPPFMDRAPQIYFQHYFEPPPDPRTFVQEIPEPCVRVLMRALAKEPADRYQSAAEMRGELEPLLRDPIATEQNFQFLGPSRESMQSARVIPSLPPVIPEAEADSLSPSQAQLEGVKSEPVPSSSWRRWLGLSILVLGLLLGAAALAGKFRLSPHAVEPAPPPPAVTPPSAPAAAPTALPIGILQSLSGKAAESERGIADAALLAIEGVNASGGLLGRPLEPAVIDGKSDASTFIAGAEQLIKERRVSVVFGGGDTESRRAIRQIVESHDALLIYASRYEGEEASPNILYTGGLPNQRALPTLEFCRENLNRHRFFLLGDDHQYSQTITALLKEKIIADGYGKVVGEHYFSADPSDLGKVVARIKAAKADVILNSLRGMLGPLHAALHAAHLTPRQVATISLNVDKDELHSLGGIDLADDYLASDYFEELPGPENASFSAAFKKKYGADRPVTAEMEAAYLGVQLWAQTVKSLGSEKPSAVRAALKGRTFVAPEGEVRVDPENNHLWKPFYMARLKAGNQVSVVYRAPAAVKPEPLSTATRVPAKTEP